MAKRNPPPTKRGMKMRRVKASVLTKKMRIGGIDKFTEIVQGSTPLSDGIYIVYYEYNPPQAWSKTKEVAGMKIDHYSNGKWGSTGTVYAYVGPLPTLSLPPLQEISPPYLVAQSFFIGTLDQAASDRYRKGPFPQYMLAFLQKASLGEYIFCLDSEDPDPYPISKYKQRKDKEWCFLEMGKDEVFQCGRMLARLRKKR